MAYQPVGSGRLMWVSKATIFTPLANEFSVAFKFVCSFVCFCCLLATLLKKLWTDCDEMLWRVRGGNRNKWIDFGSNPDHHTDCQTGNLAIKLWSRFWWNFRDSTAMIQGTNLYFLDDQDYHADSPNRESGQYGVMRWLDQGALRCLSVLVCSYFDRNVP